MLPPGEARLKQRQPCLAEAMASLQVPAGAQATRRQHQGSATWIAERPHRSFPAAVPVRPQASSSQPVSGVLAAEDSDAFRAVEEYMLSADGQVRPFHSAAAAPGRPWPAGTGATAPASVPVCGRSQVPSSLHRPAAEMGGMLGHHCGQPIPNAGASGGAGHSSWVCGQAFSCLPPLSAASDSIAPTQEYAPALEGKPGVVHPKSGLLQAEHLSDATGPSSGTNAVPGTAAGSAPADQAAAPGAGSDSYTGGTSALPESQQLSQLQRALGSQLLQSRARDVFGRKHRPAATSNADRLCQQQMLAALRTQPPDLPPVPQQLTGSGRQSEGSLRLHLHEWNLPAKVVQVRCSASLQPSGRPATVW